MIEPRTLWMNGYNDKSYRTVATINYIALNPVVLKKQIYIIMYCVHLWVIT